MNRSLTATAVCALLSLTGSPAAQKKAVAKALTPESSLSARSISDLQLSPDGSKLLFEVPEALSDNIACDTSGFMRNRAA